jgi:hypothetical protein
LKGGEKTQMANKRMFTMKIVDSDAFLDMPLSAQCLYFHLNMRADDDGFVGNPKRVMKIVSASEDDLKLLIMKKFVLAFDGGVIVIKHWRMHNTLSQNRYHETQYLDEKSLLKIKQNGSYSFEKGDIIDDSRLIGAKDKYDKDDRLTNGLQMADSDLDIDKGIGKDLGKDPDKGIGKDLGKDSDMNTSYSCPEPEKLDTGQKVISLILNDKTFHDVYQKDIEKWNELFPAVDVMQELRKMVGWLDSNPTKRKTKRGINRFINNWLSNAQDKGGTRNNYVQYQNQTAQMLEQSYDMMDNWATKKEMEERRDDN